MNAIVNAILGCQEYPWSQVYQARGQNLSEHLPQVFDALKRCGVRSWEPFLPASKEAAEQMGALLKARGLSMASAYANVRLHEEDWADHVEAIVESASWVGKLGARVLVVNPEPIKWNQPIDKDDAQLATQARAMEALGEALRQHDQVLAYHIHAPEMRREGRELHWTLQNTDPKAVGLCLDTHWIYRGAGDSQAALDEALRKYQARIVSLHLRQSRGGVWSETLEDGDVDYEPLAGVLREMKFAGPLVIEQAREAGTPSTMEPEAALGRGVAWARKTFGAGE